MRYVVRSVDGAEYGPFTSDELRQLVREQRLGPGDFIRREEGRTWSPFEKIAGLADIEAMSPTSDPSTDMSTDPVSSVPGGPDLPVEPPRLRPDPGPEQIDGGSTAPPSPPHSRPVGIQLDDLRGSVNEPNAGSTPAASGSPQLRRSVPIEPARSTNPFVAAGLPIDLLAGEEVEFVLVQSFLDACRDSLLGAILGHRGRLVCTSRRAVSIMPGFGRSSMTVVWLDRIAGAAVRSRTSMARMVFGVIGLLYAAYALVGSFAVGAAMNALGTGGAAVGGITAILGTIVAGLAALLGLYLLLTARGRAVIIGDGHDGIAFMSAAATPWHLAQIDAGRMRSTDSTVDASA